MKINPLFGTEPIKDLPPFLIVEYIKQFHGAMQTVGFLIQAVTQKNLILPERAQVAFARQRGGGDRLGPAITFKRKGSVFLLSRNQILNGKDGIRDQAMTFRGQLGVSDSNAG